MKGKKKVKISKSDYEEFMNDMSKPESRQLARLFGIDPKDIEAGKVKITMDGLPKMSNLYMTEDIELDDNSR